MKTCHGQEELNYDKLLREDLDKHRERIRTYRGQPINVFADLHNVSINEWNNQRGASRFKPELEKTIVFIVLFLENCKNFVICTKSSNKFGEFLSFLWFFNIFLYFHVFFLIFLIFSNFLEHSRKIKKTQNCCFL